MSEKIITCIHIPVKGRCTGMCFRYEDFNRLACKVIGCEAYDFPCTAGNDRFHLLVDRFHLLVDDEGLLHRKPYNRIASALYSPTGTGYIVGDALLCAVGTNEDGEPDIADIPIEIAEMQLFLLNSICNEED